MMAFDISYPIKSLLSRTIRLLNFQLVSHHIMKNFIRSYILIYLLIAIELIGLQIFNSRNGKSQSYIFSNCYSLYFCTRHISFFRFDQSNFIFSAPFLNYYYLPFYLFIFCLLFYLFISLSPFPLCKVLYKLIINKVNFSCIVFGFCMLQPMTKKLSDSQTCFFQIFRGFHTKILFVILMLLSLLIFESFRYLHFLCSSFIPLFSF